MLQFSQNCRLTFREEVPKRYGHTVKKGHPVEPNVYFPLS